MTQWQFVAGSLVVICTIIAAITYVEYKRSKVDFETMCRNVKGELGYDVQGNQWCVIKLYRTSDPRKLRKG